jgi:hypothetical protein
MSADEKIDIATDHYIQEALKEIGNAIDGTETQTGARIQAASLTRGVLIHCDKGVNRSPTLVLATLLLGGGNGFLGATREAAVAWRPCMSLRKAYATVLQQRAFIDPLPTCALCPSLPLSLFYVHPSLSSRYSRF